MSDLSFSRASLRRVSSSCQLLRVIHSRDQLNIIGSAAIPSNADWTKGFSIRAVVYEGPERLAVKDVPEPQAGPKDVLIEVRAAGICGSDLERWMRSRIRTDKTGSFFSRYYLGGLLRY